MSQVYARLVGGKFTAIRYSEEALRFAATIADVIKAGDEIVPVIEPLPNTGTAEAPVFRDPTALELANKVVAVADLAKPLYTRDMGIAGGVASLDEHGDVFDAQLPEEVVEYLGPWDPRNNTPKLEDGKGRIGNSYKVVDGVGNDDFEIDLGSGPIYVRGGMSIIYRAEVGKEAEGRYAVQGTTGLSDDDRHLLENSMQNIVNYDVVCTPAAPEVAKGGVILAQLSSENNPYPEFALKEDGGLTGITLNAMSGELRIPTAENEAGVHKIKVVVGGNMGQTDPKEIVVTINPAASE